MSVAASLFGKTRLSVLSLLFSRPEEKLYFRHICRSIKAGHGAVQRELKALGDAGIIRRTVSGRQVYYQADSEALIYAELKGLLMKTTGAGSVLRRALSPLAERIGLAFIYGSMARGEERQGSDIDLLIIGEVTFSEVVLKLQGAQGELGREVNPTVYSSKEFLAKMRAKHHFVSSVLAGDKIFLIGDTNELERLAAERLARRPRNEPAGNR